jgi:hypothetical protein
LAIAEFDDLRVEPQIRSLDSAVRFSSAPTPGNEPNSSGSGPKSSLGPGALNDETSSPGHVIGSLVLAPAPKEPLTVAPGVRPLQLWLSRTRTVDPEPPSASSTAAGPASPFA